MAPRAKKTEQPVAETKKATKKAAAPKTVEINIQRPGQIPEKFKVPAGSTLSNLKNTLNLDGYVFAVNGGSVNDSYTFQKDDLVRIGLKTKQG